MGHADTYEEISHSIAWEGLPLWSLLPLAAVVGYLLWRLYARELARLSPSRRLAIRVLRALVLAVLLLAMANPVFETITSHFHRPLVALLVDRSRSMGLPYGDQRPEETIRLALALGEVPHQERSAAAERIAAAVSNCSIRLQRSLKELREVAAELEAEPQNDACIKRFMEMVQTWSHRLIRETAEELERARADAGTLVQAFGGEPSLLRQACQAERRLARLDEVVLKGFIGDHLKRAADYQGTPMDQIEVGEALLEMADAIDICETLVHAFRQLQEALDRQLLDSLDAGARQKIEALTRRSRIEVARSIVNRPDGLLDILSGDYRVRLYGLDDHLSVQSDPGRPQAWQVEGVGTDIGGGLRRLRDELSRENLSGVVLLSDGRHTEGPSPVEAARRFAALGRPLHTVGIGSRVPPRDISIAQIHVPGTVCEGEPLEVKAYLHAQDLSGGELTGTLSLDGPLASTKVRIEAGAGSVEMRFPPVRLPPGDHTLTVSVSEHEGETLTENNRRTCRVRVLKGRRRVLVVEGFPRWQHIDMSRVLAEDPHVDVDEVILAVQPERKKVRNEKLELVPGKARRLQRGHRPGTYPATREALFKYDLVVIGDFPILDLTHEEQQALTDLVRFRGGSLVLLAGHRHIPYDLEESALDEVLPIVLPVLESETAHAAFRPYHQYGFGLRLTSAGRAAGLCRLSSDVQKNIELWERLPVGFWRYPSLAAHPEATVLVQTQGTQEEPVVAVREVGLGRVLYVGLDETWRWKSLEGRLTGTFWRNMLRWATASGVRQQVGHIGLATSKASYAPGEAVTVGVQVVDDNGVGVPDDVLSVSAYLSGDNVKGDEGSNPVREHPLDPLPRSPGIYRGVLPPLPDGTFTLRLSSAVFPRDASSLKDITFSVGRDPAMEFMDPTLNRAGLEEMAAETGGSYFSLDRLPDLLRKLPKVESRTSTRREGRSLWDNYAFLLLLLVLLGTEWILRKRAGLL